MNRILPVIFCGLLIFVSVNASAITLDELLQNHLRALGGREAIMNMNSFHYRADVQMGTAAGKAEMFYRKPDMLLVKIDLAILSVQQGRYGNHYWLKDQTGNLREMAGTEIKQFVTENYVGTFAYLLDDALRQHMSSPVSEDFGGKPCYKVEFVPPDGDRITLYFDPDNFLIIGSRSNVMGLPIVATYSDWRIVEGIKMPFITVQDLGNPLLLTKITITGVEANIELSDEIFRPPTSAPRPFSLAGDVDSMVFPFELDGPHIYLPVSLNGLGPYRFLLDSGAGMSIVAKHLADNIGLKDAGNLPAAGIGGLEVGNFVRIDSMAVGGATLYDLTSGAIDFAPLTTGLATTIDGVVGYELFSRLIVDIDYDAQIIRLYNPEANIYPGGADTIVCEIESNHPIVEGIANDSIVGRFRIDTGSNNYLDLNAPFVKKHALLATAGKSFGSVPLRGVGGETRTTAALLPSFRLGKSRMENLLTGFFEAESGILAAEHVDGNIGGGLLSRFRVGFDYPNRKIYLTGQGDNDPGQAFLNSGLLLQKSNGLFKVYRILPGTPAEKSGLKIGDVLMKISGQEVGNLSLKEVYELLDGEDGTKINFVIQRDGKTKKAKMVIRKIT